MRDVLLLLPHHADRPQDRLLHGQGRQQRPPHTVGGGACFYVCIPVFVRVSVLLAVKVCLYACLCVWLFSSLYDCVSVLSLVCFPRVCVRISVPHLFLIVTGYLTQATD